jgi:hypothetical protein
MRFYWDNLSFSAVVIASSEASGYPVSNLQDRQLTKLWRSTGLSGEWVKFDMGAAADVQAILIAAHNFTVGATVKIQGNATDSWGAPSVDVTLSIAELIRYHWGAVQSYQWWRILVTDVANPDGYVEYGLQFLGLFLDIEDIYREFPEDNLDSSTKSIGITGQVFGDEGIITRLWTFQLPYLANIEKLALIAVFNSLKTIRAFFFTWDPAAVPIEIYYGTFNDDVSCNHILNYQWNSNIAIKEAF